MQIPVLRGTDEIGGTVIESSLRPGILRKRLDFCLKEMDEIYSIGFQMESKYSSHRMTDPNINTQNGNISDDTIRFRQRIISLRTTMIIKDNAVRPYFTITKVTGP